MDRTEQIISRYESGETMKAIGDSLSISKYRVWQLLKEHPLWNRYRHMIARCHLPHSKSFKWYGARGIKVCDRWLNGDGESLTGFQCFVLDMGEPPTPKHTLNRKENSGSYEPGNVEWATRKDQARNLRTTRFVTFRGQRISLTALCEQLGLNRNAVYLRLWRGQDIEQAILPR